MSQMIYCLVGKRGKVYAKDGVHSHTELARIFRIDGNKCLKYRFDLSTRKIFRDLRDHRVSFPAKQSHKRVAQGFFDKCAGTPEKLMAYILKGNWDGIALLRLLTVSARAKCGKTCDAAEMKCGKTCDAARAKHDRACAAARAKCNKARAAAEVKRVKVCVAAQAKRDKTYNDGWIWIFKNPENRIKIWKK